MAKDNTETIRRYFAYMDKNGTPDQEMLTPDLHVEIAGFGKFDKRGYVAFVESFFTGIPDLKHSVQKVCATNDSIGFTSNVSGTHKGTLNGIPGSGKKVNLLIAGVIQTKNGQFSNMQVVVDTMTLMQQIGAVPMATAA